MFIFERNYHRKTWIIGISRANDSRNMRRSIIANYFGTAQTSLLSLLFSNLVCVSCLIPVVALEKVSISHRRMAKVVVMVSEE